MAFRLGAAIGGAAKRASEILDKEREEALANTEDEIKILTQLGLPKAQERRSKRIEKEKMYDSLSKHFEGDDVAVIMAEGTGQNVLDHIASMQKNYENYKVNPREIVIMDPGQEAHGYTKDQVLDLVMGKVAKGVPVLDAMDQVTGKQRGSGLTGLLGGNLDSVRTERMDAIATATGVSMSELAALASDSIVYDDIQIKGKTRLFDPAAAASATKDTYTAAQMDVKLLSGIGSQIKSSESAGYGGLFDEDIIYKFTDNKIATAVNQKIREVTLQKRKEKEENGDYGAFNTQDLQDMENALNSWVKTAKVDDTYISTEPEIVNNGNQEGKGPLNLEGLGIAELERTLKEELKPQDGKLVDSVMASTIAKQIREAMINANSNLTEETIDNFIKRVLNMYGYNKETKDNSIVVTN